MNTLLIAIASFVGFIVAYHTYGRWLARKIFGLDPTADVPSKQLRDDVDYVPTRKEIIFGHHFTSIAGTGPIVGPAIAVFWGWLPALLWVVFGSIFIGAVHDFGALVVSLRSRGQTVGEVAGRMISPRAKYLFLLVLFFALCVVLAIFGLVIAVIFAQYPEAVLSVWIEIPLAIAIGFWVYKRGGNILVPSLIALAIMYLAIYVGTYHVPLALPKSWGSPIVIWTIILLSYCFFASVLPVWALLQPRDFINSHQLMLALGLLVIGLLLAGVTGQADINAAPVIASDIPPDAPPIWPFLFITIACGAVSGFHCLVSSGTSSKQVSSEGDAQYVGYGAMLLEGALAVIVITACCAGVGMGRFARADTGRLAISPQTGDYYHQVLETPAGSTAVTGAAAWKAYYPTTRTIKGVEVGGWSTHRLQDKVGAFVEGGANFLGTLGIPLRLGIAIIAVLVASFAATTLDTATRLQRYVIQELAGGLRLRPLTNKYAATAFALVLGGGMAMIPGPKGVGTGGLILWPLFGATNQLLAGLAFLVIVFYLWRRNQPIWFAAIPLCIMVIMPAWALGWNLFHPVSGWVAQSKHLLVVIGLATMGLQLWMVVEAVMVWPRAKGVLEDALPPLPSESGLQASGGRSC